MQAPADTQERGSRCVFYLHTVSQAGQKAQLSQAGAGPLKPIRGVFAVTKQHNEIRQEEWGMGRTLKLCVTDTQGFKHYT